MAHMSFIYLASRSPRRRELLTQAGIPFRLLDVDIDESVTAGESAHDYVQRLARAKACSAWQSLARNADPAPVLAADTTVALDGRLLGKPEDAEQAVDMLMALQGRRHNVLTGIAVCLEQLVESCVVSTSVQFGDYSRDMALRYVATGEPMDKAGSYGIQGFGAALVAGIEGSYSNVVGLPVKETVELVTRFGVPFWQKLSCAQHQ